MIVSCLSAVKSILGRMTGCGKAKRVPGARLHYPSASPLLVSSSHGPIVALLVMDSSVLDSWEQLRMI